MPHGYADPALIERDLIAGSLSRVSIERLVLSGSVTFAAALAEGFRLGAPLRFELEERGSLEELTLAVAGEMTARLGEGPLTGSLAGFLVSARNSG